MKRQAEAKKAEKLKKNLHLIDFPKGNNKIKFVGSYEEIKEHAASSNINDQEIEDGVGTDREPKVRVDTEAIRKEVMIQQSDNK